MSSTPKDPSFPNTPQGPVMVVGGAGYIGSHTVRLLQSRSVPCVVFDNLSTGHRQAIPDDVPFVQADLADREAIGRALQEHKIQSVIHFAAKCYVGESVTEPSKYYRENVFNTWNLLEEMRTHNVMRIVFSSTCATYGNPVQVPMDESHPQKPINPYGHTKLHMEHMMGDYSTAYGLSYAALRYFNAAGAASGGCLGEHHEPETHLIPLVLQVALGQREFISIFGDDYETPDGTCIRDYIHVDDLGDAHLRALCQLEAGAQELHVNLGTGTGFSVKELIEMAREVTGHAIPARMGERRDGDPPQLVSGGTRALDLLGWKPEKAALKRILEDAWSFHRKHPGGYE
ncbi:MAG: UDP-glucose 4-epimerase GalE [Planctomycetota bacterium]|nr:UDP-glucose 4-epimerase GalE [Planctomycetota bacterium]